MNRAREMCGVNVTTITLRQRYRSASRRSSRPSPKVVGGSGTKQSTSMPECGVLQAFVNHSLSPSGFDRTYLGCPALHAEIEAERVPAESVSAEDEDRVGVPQWIDLWSDVEREPADHGGDQQQADRYHHPSDAKSARGQRHGQPIPRNLAASAVRRIRSACTIDGCPTFHQCLILGQESGLGGNHVYPTASPAACFAGAGRLIAHVFHHIQIVSAGLPFGPAGCTLIPPANVYRRCTDRFRRDPVIQPFVGPSSQQRNLL